MPWRHAKLRGTRVLARCKPDGDFQVRAGRVEIRYRPEDGRAYRAAARNLEPEEGSAILPDAHCAEGRPATSSAKKASGSAKRKGKASGGSAEGHPAEPQGAEILVYADGACSGNPGPAGLGVVMQWDDRGQELSEYLGEGTNNIAELTAILRAAEAVEDVSRPVRLHTDSSYSIGVLVRGWKAKANRELVAQVKRALAALEDVELFHVPGHAGVPLNERADELARLAIETRASTGWRPL